MTIRSLISPEPALPLKGAAVSRIQDTSSTLTLAVQQDLWTSPQIPLPSFRSLCRQNLTRSFLGVNHLMPSLCIPDNVSSPRKPSRVTTPSSGLSLPVLPGVHTQLHPHTSGALLSLHPAPLLALPWGPARQDCILLSSAPRTYGNHEPTAGVQ